MSNTLKQISAALAVPALGLTLIACSSQSNSTTSTTPQPASAASTSRQAETTSLSPAPSPTASAQPGAAALEIPIQIHGGAVTPLNAQFDATVGQPITLRVESDVDEELHVHSVPEHEYEVRPKSGQVFTFSVAVPGQVAIELHQADKTVATLIVR